MGVTKLDVKNAILSKATTLGNSEYTEKELCSDLVNSWGTTNKQLEILSAITFLSVTTLRRVASLEETEHGEPYNPNYDTLRRILVAFGAQAHYTVVKIQNRYMPKPKTEV